MITYKTEVVKQQIFDKFFCDKCKKEITSKDKNIANEMELQEAYSISFTGGYTSVFGDGNNISCDLCQYCLKELIGDICHVNDYLEE